MTEPRSISELLEDVRASITAENVTLDSLLEAFHERGFGFLLLLFAFPAALPIPALGINTIISAPLFFLTIQQMIGRHTIWLPCALRRKTITRAFIYNVLDSALPWTRRLEHLFKPRIGFVTQAPVSRLIGLFGLLMVFSIILPVPLTNTVPALGIAVMAAGVLMRDGLAVILGAVVGLVWIALLIGVIIVFGPEGIDLLKAMIRSLL